MIDPGDIGSRAHAASALAGDEHAFQRLVDPYRRELLIHNYRLLGSLEDAEDTLQEAMLRAWRGLDSFEGRASLRAWLYKISTNAALDTMAGRRKRAMPVHSFPPTTPGQSPPRALYDPLWLEPLPDNLIDDRPAHDPAARYDALESVEIAFLAALQNLPGRQRAVLILRDVLGWKADEVATLLDTSIQAVNSALQRARATMKRLRADRIAVAGTTNTELASLLARYVAAWEANDSAGLVALLHEDAVLTMPPLPEWYLGRSAIGWFLDTRLFSPEAGHRFRLLATQANGSPGFAVYQIDALGVYKPVALQVLTVSAGKIAEIHDFLTQEARFFSRFGLPSAI